MLLYLYLLKIKSDALGIKSLVLIVHLAVQRSSKNIHTKKIVHGILLEKWRIQPIKNGNLFLLSRKHRLLFWCQHLKTKDVFRDVRL